MIRFFHNFHGNLMVPGVGRSIVGWLGVLMSISCFTGLWLWWPMVGRLARAFRWRRQPQFDTNLHHMVGFWIALPLALLSVTGVLISFPSLTGGGQRGGSDGAQAPPPARRAVNSPPLTTTHLSVDEAIAASGVREAPFTVNWPTEASPSWRISTTGAVRRTVTIDDASGATTASGRRALRPGQRSLVRRLHDGTDMGLLFQTIIFLGGIAPAALGITGITMWLRTRRWRGEAARRIAPAARPRPPPPNRRIGIIRGGELHRRSRNTACSARKFAAAALVRRSPLRNQASSTDDAALARRRRGNRRSSAGGCSRSRTS